MKAEAVKAWISVVLASFPLTWVLFASADTVYGFVIESAVLLTGFYMGYARNRRTIHPALLIVPGYVIALLAIGFAIASEIAVFVTLVFVAMFGTAPITAGIGSLVRRHIWPLAGDREAASANFG